MQSIPLISETVQTSSRSQMVDITERISKLIRQHKVSDGFLIIHVPHTTAGVTMNEHADPDVQHDVITKLANLVPQMENYYQHDEGNSDAHVKTSYVGNSLTVLVEGGKLVLGRWQGIFFCEFDGPRERRINVKLVGLG
jgi:secondary thiamine-phosphate synthase enzyme